MEGKISVIVPTYNNASWLPRCLNSILAQSYRNLEILVVNDGSTDNTAEILEEYARADERIRVVHKENGGVTSARLRGVSEATGEWIGFVDADDFIEPQMYAILLKNAERNAADISHCGHRMVYPDGRVRYYYNSGALIRQDRWRGLRDLLEEEIVEPGLCNKLYKRKLFQGLHSQMDMTIRNNEDLLMNYYLFSRAECSVFEDICPYHYMIREGSASQAKLTVHSIYDPIRVKEIILEGCEPELYEDVRRTMVTTCLFAYAQLCRGMEKEYAGDRKKVRRIIREQCPYLSMLPVKNAVLVLIVSYFPMLFHLVYGVYYRWLKKM